jgi:hypothetical protein
MFWLILTPRRAFFFIALIMVLSILLGCASTQLVPDANTEKWVGKISGMARGDLKLFIKQIQGQSDLYLAKSPFVMNLDATAGGYGKVEVTGHMKGKVKNGIIKAKIFGNAQVGDSFYQISGEMIGTISKTQAFGTWKIRHIKGLHSGKWTAKKMVE